MRVASFNVESLFGRPRALTQKTWAEGRPGLESFAQLNALLDKEVYTDQDKAAIVDPLNRA